MLPILVASIATIGDVFDKYDFIELSEGEGEQSEERDSEEKEAKDAIKEFLFQDHYANSDLKILGLENFARSNVFSTISTDVLTPPPETI